jgi:hypothetical protein
MSQLDPEYPILFFPIRIETKFANRGIGLKSLKIRFFPDQIGVDSFDPRLTQQEIADAKNYWDEINKITNDNTIDQETKSENTAYAWQNLENKYNCSRAAYIAKAVINFNPESNPYTNFPGFRQIHEIQTRSAEEQVEAVCKILPSRFFVYGKFKNDLGDLEGIQVCCTPATINVDLSPFSGRVSESLKWMIDFQTAKDNGMAVEIPLSERQYQSGFEHIIVFGIKDNLPPKNGRLEVENLFNSHHYTDGFSFLRQGTPTNLAKDQPTEYTSSSIVHTRVCHSIEFPPPLPKPIVGSIVDTVPDGRVFERVLGIEGVSYGVKNAENMDQTDAAYISLALWPALLGYYLQSFVNYNEPLKAIVRRHFIRYVRGQGSIPPFRIGKVPYGILPITLVSEWADRNIVESNVNYIIRTLFTSLRTRWLDEFVVNYIPTVANPKPGTPPEDTLINILSQEAVSHTYHVRGIRSLDYILSAYGRIDDDRSAVLERSKMLNNYHLRKTFKNNSTNIPEDVIREIYRLVPGRGLRDMTVLRKEEDKPLEEEAMLPPVQLFSEFNGNPNHQFRNYIKIMSEEPDSFIRPIHGQFIFARGQTITEDGYNIYNAEVPNKYVNYDSLLFKLLRYSAGFIGNNDNKIINPDPQAEQEFIDSLKYLSAIDPDKDAPRLQYLMFTALDLVSYRLDAWLTSFANQRLECIRQRNRTGLYIGAYGWVEDLMPKEITQGGNNNNNNNNNSNSIQGGYIHAPSLSHAKAAAVLRSGYLNHLTFDDQNNNILKKDLLKVNLNSERTKDALELIDGIGRGAITLGELLGYRFERRLHDARLDHLIDEFRKHFPLIKDNVATTNTSTSSSNIAEEITRPRVLADGLIIYQNWKRLVETLDSTSIEAFIENDAVWKGLATDIAKYGPISNIITQIKPHLDFLLEVMDGLSDLCIAESMYQAVNANYERSAAMLDSLGGNGQIPIPEIANIPRSGVQQTQSIILVFEAKQLQDNEPLTTPRIIGEPNLNRILESYYGDVKFFIDVKSEDGATTSEHLLGLSDIGIGAIDLLYAPRIPVEEDKPDKERGYYIYPDLERRLEYYAKERWKNNFARIRYKRTAPIEDDPDQDIKSLSDIKFLLEPLRIMIAQGRRAQYFDFATPLQKENAEVVKKEGLLTEAINDILKRFYDLLVLFVDTSEELRQLRGTQSSSLDPQVTTKKKDALLRASLFGIPLAIPLGKDGNILSADTELDEKITTTLNDLSLRGTKLDKYINRLPEWRRITDESSLLRKMYDDFKAEEKVNLDNLIDKMERELEIIIGYVRIILGDESFQVLPPFTNPSEFLGNFKTSRDLNNKARKWLQKTGYVKPKVKLFDDAISFNDILESGYFAFYYDEMLFQQSAQSLMEQQQKETYLSLVIAISSRSAEDFPDQVSHYSDSSISQMRLAGLVIDEWPEKIPLSMHDTAVAFHYDAPSTEAPQSLLLAVSPNDDGFIWNEDTIRDVILEALDLVKIRAVDYRSLKELRNYLPTDVLNSYGENTKIKSFRERE